MCTIFSVVGRCRYRPKEDRGEQGIKSRKSHITGDSWITETHFIGFIEKHTHTHFIGLFPLKEPGVGFVWECEQFLAARLELSSQPTFVAVVRLPASMGGVGQYGCRWSCLRTQCVPQQTKTLRLKMVFEPRSLHYLCWNCCIK